MTGKVWTHSKAGGNALLVLLALADHADDDGRCWPGMKRLAARTRTSVPTVRRAIHELEAIGELTIEQLGTGHRSTRYRLRPGQGCQSETSQSDTPEVSTRSRRGVTGDTAGMSRVRPEPSRPVRRESSKNLGALRSPGAKGRTPSHRDPATKAAIAAAISEGIARGQVRRAATFQIYGVASELKEAGATADDVPDLLAKLDPEDELPCDVGILSSLWRVQHWQSRKKQPDPGAWPTGATGGAP